VLRGVGTQQTRWPEPVRVSANLSALQIRPELVDDVAAPLCEYRLTPRAAVPRVTDSTVLNSAVKPVITQLWARRQAGPDFGVG
jgi:predicted signal transduction protein with EAL and GGDEF domain